MTNIKQRKVVKGLTDKHFVPIKPKSDHIWYGLTVDDQLIPQIKTKIGHGSKYKNLGDSLLKLIYKQLEMENIQQLEDFIDCPYTYEEYLNDLRDKGILTN